MADDLDPAVWCYCGVRRADQSPGCVYHQARARKPDLDPAAVERAAREYAPDLPDGAPSPRVTANEYQRFRRMAYVEGYRAALTAARAGEPAKCAHPGGGDVDERGLCAWHRTAARAGACDTCGGSGVLGDDTCPGGCERGAKVLDPPRPAAPTVSAGLRARVGEPACPDRYDDGLRDYDCGKVAGHAGSCGEPAAPTVSAESLDLDAIRERLADASDGPWRRYETMQADVYVIGPGGLLGDDLVAGPTYNIRNADFIAAARDDVPALLAEVERLRAALSRAEDTVTVYRADSERARRAERRAEPAAPSASAEQVREVLAHARPGEHAVDSVLGYLGARGIEVTP